jgi:hypothetical protein
MMLDTYILGVTIQLEKRIRELLLRIPRNLPRDYDTLAQKCREQLNSLICQFRRLRTEPEYRKLETQPTRLRRLKRAVADLDLLETAGIAALYRAREDDHRLNELLEKIAKEIDYPLVTPVVTTLSQQYFYIYPELNLLCVPLSEGRFLLHLPDLYHELAHPLLAARDEPLVEPFQKAMDVALREIIEYLHNERVKADRRRGPEEFGFQIDLWSTLWVRAWLIEFFCDLFAVYTLGPAFVWAHMHLAIIRGGNPFDVPRASSSSHPADDARMRVMLCALSSSGFGLIAADIENRWETFLRHSGAMAEPEYRRCYPEPIIRELSNAAREGVEQMGCRLATQSTDDPVHKILNHAWGAGPVTTANHRLRDSGVEC